MDPQEQPNQEPQPTPVPGELDGGFKGPDSVTLQPPSAETPALPGDDLNARVGADQAAGFTSQIPGVGTYGTSLQGWKENKKREEAAAAQAKEEKGRSALDAINRRLDNTKLGQSKVGQYLKNKLNGAKNALLIARALTGDITAIKDLLVLWWKPLLAIAICITLVFVSIGVAVYGASGGLGDPAGGTPSGVQISGTYCKGMSPTYTKPGSGVQLQVTSSTGKFSLENYLIPTGDDAGYVRSPSGQARPKDAPGQTFFFDKLRSLFATNPSWADYYITARWPFDEQNFGGPAFKKFIQRPTLSGTQYAKMISAYAGTRVILYNPKTDKAVLGIVAEYGPQPWTGSEGNSKEYFAQLGLWQKDSHGGFRSFDPKGYIERIAGGSQIVADALGADNQTPIVFGFAPEELQNSAPGPINCTKVVSPAGGTSSAAGGNPTSGSVANPVPQPLSVPGIKEGAASQCGIASVSAVGRYYNNSYASEYIAKGSDTTKVGACPGSLINHLNEATGGNKGFVVATTKAGSNHVSYEDVKASVLSGDPVIIYSGDNPFSDSPGKHIYVIRGWNEATKTFYIMNPWITKAGGPSFQYFDGKTAKGEPITVEFLQNSQRTNESVYPGGRYFMIRSKYVHKT